MQTDLYQQFLTQLEHGLSLLQDKPEETADSTLRALWQLACDNPMSVERAGRTTLPDLSGDTQTRLADLIRQRLAGIPLAHLSGRQQFMDMEFVVGPAALVPRKETELLARTALSVLDHIVQQQQQALVIDLCTGAGNIALSLAHHQPASRVYAADLSEEAVALAESNRQQLGLQDRVEFFSGDLLTPFDSDTFHAKVDLITCNPPYISSAKLDKMPEEIAHYEPKLAFDGGPFGLNVVGKLLKQAPVYLKPGGWLIFEVGLGQGEPLQKRLSRNPDYRQLDTHRDQAGNIRVLALRT